jgi:hypothetical protein
VVVRGAPYSLKSLHLAVKAGTAAKIVDILNLKRFHKFSRLFPKLIDFAPMQSKYPGHSAFLRVETV